MKPVAAAVLLAVLLTLPACDATEGATTGPTAPAAQPTRDPAAVLAGVEQAVLDAGTVRYEATLEGGRDDAALEVEGRMAGVLDIQTDSGTADLELLPLQEMAQDAAAEDAAAAAADLAALGRMHLSWTAEDITVDMGGDQWNAPRDDDDSGVISRVPGEPAGLFAVVAAARDVALVGTEEVAGASTTRYRALGDARAAVDAGLGTQAPLAIAQLPELPLEVWVDDAGRAVQIRYSFTVPSLVKGSTRTMVTTYRYSGWGEPIDIGR